MPTTNIVMGRIAGIERSRMAITWITNTTGIVITITSITGTSAAEKGDCPLFYFRSKLTIGFPHSAKEPERR